MLKNLLSLFVRLSNFSKEIPDNVKIEYDDDEDVYSISEYDSNGNEIHYKDSKGYEIWREYDSNGMLIHSKNNKGYKNWY